MCLTSKDTQDHIYFRKNGWSLHPNLECNEILTKTLRTSFFKSFLSDKLKDFLNELIKIRNTKTGDRKRKNIG